MLVADDQPAYRALRLLGLRLYPENFLSSLEEEQDKPSDEDRETLSQGLSRGLFDQNRTLIGMSSFVPETAQRAAHRAYIGGFNVHPDAQGKGAAQALMRNLVAEARDRGVWQLELYVNEANARARRFYEKHGFRVAGTLPNSIIADAGPETDLFMVCDLRDSS
ncbi:GNAT family N-acetyltransferase [Shimia ponticola]|uniref:GNAT family N-acetyltransferase n=1 Tax=Shimia ponticola TaxID=2582893 RepID=UPI0011BEFBA8|nr:GNAT family N-acetyltransferase [Shimia ponticola]